MGLLEARAAEQLSFTLYDTSVADVDTVINEELVRMGFAFN